MRTLRRVFCLWAGLRIARKCLFLQQLCYLYDFDGRDVEVDGEYIHRGLNGPPSLLAAIGQMLQEKTAPVSANLQAQQSL